MPITGRGEHICVGNPCLSLGFAALLPRKKELRNCLVQRSQAGKLQNGLINRQKQSLGHITLIRVPAKSDVLWALLSKFLSQKTGSW